MLNIVIPMAGRGSRFACEGYKQPKPLIDVGGRPMIEWVIENITPKKPHRFVFLCLKEHLAEHPDLANRLAALCPVMEIVEVSEVTAGAACTVLLASEFIDNNDALLIANSDQVVDIDVDDFIQMQYERELDGLIMTFHADDPKWSFCRMDGEKVTGVFEKKVVSNEATVGIYLFRRGSDFVRAARKMISAGKMTNNEYYVAPVYNELIDDEDSRIGVYRIDGEGVAMHGLGIPSDLRTFQQTKYYAQRARVGLTHEDP